MDYIAARVGDIDTVNAVMRQAPLPRLWETQEKPTAFLYDDDETTVEQRNNIRRAQFTMYLYIKVRSENGRQTISDQLDILQADAYQKLIWDCGASLKALGVRIQENQSPVAAKYFDDEYMGAIMLLYSVTYHTNAKSLYTTAYGVNSNLNP
uniref:Tail protein n=1 Tax=viral metagenome TaxID=1070528 RepID=A0A6M3LE86_9ZZZZ